MTKARITGLQIGGDPFLEGATDGCCQLDPPLLHTSAHRRQATSHVERIDMVRGPIGKVRVAVVPCFGADSKSKRPFKTFMRYRIVRRPIFDERTPSVPAGGPPSAGFRSKPPSSRTMI